LRVGEWVNIGDAAILVTELRSNQVKIKLEFPREERITRCGLPHIQPNEAALRCINAHQLSRD